MFSFEYLAYKHSWIRCELASFSISGWDFCPSTNRQVSPIIGKLAIVNPQFSVCRWVCWKHHVDQNRNDFTNSTVFGGDKIILFAWERGEHHRIGESLCGEPECLDSSPVCTVARSPHTLCRWGREARPAFTRRTGEIRRPSVRARVLFCCKMLY